jgi:ABC-type Zn uptake system ZnuABC Zn-binding protein ZnuA
MKHNETPHDHDGSDEPSFDAHIWLGEENILEIAERIRAELIAIMPEQSATFIKNTEIFTLQVTKMFDNFRVKHQ